MIERYIAPSNTSGEGKYYFVISPSYRMQLPLTQSSNTDEILTTN